MTRAQCVTLQVLLPSPPELASLSHPVRMQGDVEDWWQSRSESQTGQGVLHEGLRGG